MPYPSRITFSGVIQNNAPVYFDGSAAQKRRDFFQAHNGKDFIVTVEAVKDAKTLQQLAFFHGPLLQSFIEITGNASKSAVKQYLKDEFLSRVEEVNGVAVKVTPSLANISKSNMRTFIDSCLNLLYELGGDLTVEGRNEYESITGGNR